MPMLMVKAAMVAAMLIAKIAKMTTKTTVMVKMMSLKMKSSCSDSLIVLNQ